MKNNKIINIINEQDKFFKSGKTEDISFRIDTLKKLKSSIIEHEEEIFQALYKDLKKSKFESYATEIGIILDELNFFIKNLKKISKNKKVKTNFINFPAKSFIHYEPYGRTLIISPWNYPFQLTIAPLIGSIAAGNTSVLKPSELSEETSKIIDKIISKTFQRNHVAVIEGGVEINKIILNERWDFIFFTGSVNVGKIIMGSAAKHLTPVVLELGGKSPAVVTDDANLKVSAKRLVWGKLINAGQTCIAPDYLLVQRKIKDKFIKLCIDEIKNSYGENPMLSKDYVKIINPNHFKRVLDLLKGEKIIYGGKSNKTLNIIEPTIVENVSLNSSIMKEEIFGPILPVITFDSLNEAFDIINKIPNPLASYIFTENKKTEKQFLQNVKSGSACINDTVVQISNPALPFGGKNTSGIGRYHGRASFEAFSNQKSVLKQKTLFDLPLRYPPYKNKLKMIKLILK